MHALAALSPSWQQRASAAAPLGRREGQSLLPEHLKVGELHLLGLLSDFGVSLTCLSALLPDSFSRLNVHWEMQVVVLSTAAGKCPCSQHIKSIGIASLCGGADPWSDKEAAVEICFLQPQLFQV